MDSKDLISLLPVRQYACIHIKEDGTCEKLDNISFETLEEEAIDNFLRESFPESRKRAKIETSESIIKKSMDNIGLGSTYMTQLNEITSLLKQKQHLMLQTCSRNGIQVKGFTLGVEKSVKIKKNVFQNIFAIIDKFSKDSKDLCERRRHHAKQLIELKKQWKLCLRSDILKKSSMDYTSVSIGNDIIGIDCSFFSFGDKNPVSLYRNFVPLHHSPKMNDVSLMINESMLIQHATTMWPVLCSENEAICSLNDIPAGTLGLCLINKSTGSRIAFVSLWSILNELKSIDSSPISRFCCKKSHEGFAMRLFQQFRRDALLTSSSYAASMTSLAGLESVKSTLLRLEKSVEIVPYKYLCGGYPVIIEESSSEMCNNDEVMEYLATLQNKSKYDENDITLDSVQMSRISIALTARYSLVIEVCPTSDVISTYNTVVERGLKQALLSSCTALLDKWSMNSNVDTTIDRSILQLCKKFLNCL